MLSRALDELFMRRAIALAKKADVRQTSPNPRVGCVIALNGKVVGTGFHKKFGGPHAEVFALREAGNKAEGAAAYVSLEPCNHFGKTPPCTRALVSAGVARVVCAGRDPNAKAKGGLEFLQKRGIAAESGVLEEEARDVNKGFFSLVQTGLPFVAIKAAISSDGFIAPKSHSKKPVWISGVQSRRLVHRLRNDFDSILVGVGTVLADDPKLTVRIAGKRIAKQPLRVILDSALRAPLGSKVFADGNALVAVARGADAKKKKALESRGIVVLECPLGKNGEIDLRFLLKKLGERGVASVFVEGGSRVFSSFLKNGLVDEAFLFYSPKKLGGGIPVADEDAIGKLKFARVEKKRVGADLLVHRLFGLAAPKGAKIIFQKT